MNPDAPCGAQTAATWFCSWRFVVADVVWKIEKWRTTFRGERSLLTVFRKFSASALQVFCFEFVEIVFVSGFEASVWYPLLLPVFCRFSALYFVPCGDLLTCYARDGAFFFPKPVKLSSSGSQNVKQMWFVWSGEAVCQGRERVGVAADSACRSEGGGGYLSAQARVPPPPIL